MNEKARLVHHVDLIDLSLTNPMMASRRCVKDPYPIIGAVELLWNTCISAASLFATNDAGSYRRDLKTNRFFHASTTMRKSGVR